VRELQSVIDRAVILEKGPQLELTQLRQETLQVARVNAGMGADRGGGAVVQELRPSVAGPTAPIQSVMEKGLSNIRKEMDEALVRNVLIETMSRSGGNVSAVARDLKLDRANLLRLMKRFEIEPEIFRTKKAS
jgi:DNA-binding NtrC family response regulator